jgi:hypothetical protein
VVTKPEDSTLCDEEPVTRSLLKVRPPLPLLPLMYTPRLQCRGYDFASHRCVFLYPSLLTSFNLVTDLSYGAVDEIWPVPQAR